MSEHMKKEINWRVSNVDLSLVRKIVKRATTIEPRLDRTELHMDLIATHLNGCPLQLAEMSDPKKVRDFDLMHDIYGISAHLNRKTGELERCFVPRCSA